MLSNLSSRRVQVEYRDAMSLLCPLLDAELSYFAAIIQAAWRGFRTRCINVVFKFVWFDEASELIHRARTLREFRAAAIQYIVCARDMWRFPIHRDAIILTQDIYLHRWSWSLIRAAAAGARVDLAYFSDM